MRSKCEGSGILEVKSPIEVAGLVVDRGRRVSGVVFQCWEAGRLAERELLF